MSSPEKTNAASSRALGVGGSLRREAWIPRSLRGASHTIDSAEQCAAFISSDLPMKNILGPPSYASISMPNLGSIAPTRSLGMASASLRLLEAMADADATIGHLEMLAPDERHQVLVEWNLTQADYPTERFIDELFASQAERTPEHMAAVFEDQRVSYAELNRRADGLADRLRALGVGPDVMVALFLERSLEMVVGVLGVLKAGGAYVPLDPTHPRNRLAYMMLFAK